MDFLTRLFGVDDFLERCWPGKHAVAHGPIERLEPLAGLAELHDLPLLLRTYEDKVRVALADKRDEHSSLLVGAEEAAALHADGMALILNGVERFLPPVQIWLDALRTELGLPLKCDPRSIVYVSPRGSGNSPHFDANANFVVQIRGTKRWRLAPNASVTNPTDRFAMNQDDVSEELEGYVSAPMPTEMPDDAVSFELEPGSVLFVPRGTWHETESDEDTLAINFTFGQPTQADAVLAALRSRLLRDDAWRTLFRGDAGAMLERLKAEVAALEPADVTDALDTQEAWLLVPRAFLRLEDGKVIASIGAGAFEIDAPPDLHPVLEWIGRQRTPFSFEQAALHFPALSPGLPDLLRTLKSNQLLARHRCRPSPDRD